MRIKTILLSTLFLLSPFLGFAEDAENLKRQITLDQKKLYVMENMPLSDEEAGNFWPVYNEYQERLYDLELMRTNVLSYYVSNYENLTDQQMIEIINNKFDIADNRQLIMKKLTLDLEEVLPVKKVFRYLQVENNIAAMDEYSLAKKVPLME